MTSLTIKTKPFPGQQPGTSGLRKKVTEFQQPHYLENFVQAIFDCLPAQEKRRLVIGGDGRYYNREAIQSITRLAVANGFSEVLIGQHGFLSTPAASHLIRKYKLDGGIILSASHNPGGPDGDFGLKFNGRNGGPAPASFTDQVYDRTRHIEQYLTTAHDDIDIDTLGQTTLDETVISVIDPVKDYADLMEHLFDFDLIKSMFNSDLFTLAFDAMHAITGPYAREILIKRLGAPETTLMNETPLPDFGGGHPDPNLAHAQDLVKLMNQKLHAPTMGAASDGDGDRNMILGNHCFVTPSDSLAVMAANAHLLPGYQSGLTGVARSMPTSQAIDKVAHHLGIECYETPTGWKYFGNLLDAGLIMLCGEESFGTGSDHIREKDGLWAVLFWLNLIAVRKQPVSQLLANHWRAFGRHYYTRHDYEAVDMDSAQSIFSELAKQLSTLAGKRFDEGTVKLADNFRYQDPVDHSITENQGVRIIFDNDSRIIFRLSGTGTEGATVRVYYEKYQAPDAILDADTQELLGPMFDIAQQIAGIQTYTGRSSPDVVT